MQDRMRELVQLLNEAGRAYYQEGREIMPNLRYDALYDELVMLEQKTGIVLSQSPTQKVGYEVLSELPKERHQSPMLSLAKTKEREELRSWLGTQEGLLSWKLDGLTVVLSYEGGSLVKAVTRGNGEIGEVVTGNARAFQNVPARIPFPGSLVLRGEAIISYSDFARINAELPEADAKYKNPRNLCAGSVRQLDPRITRERNVRLLAFALVSALSPEGEALDFENSRERQFAFLSEQGFTVVEHRRVNAETVSAAVQDFENRIADNDFPSDGLVLLYEDIAYGDALGRTAKFPRNAIAFKWSDEEAETVLHEVEWSPSRTGLINPVAVFDPVELEGTTVSRASLHNLSYCEELRLGIGDRITVYKANMIIPQIAQNLSGSGTLIPPHLCPACGMETEIRQDRDARTLYCGNPDCPAKRLKNFALLVSRDALHIDGLSEMTLEKLLGHGILRSYRDLFRLKQHREEIVALEGFGERSYEKLCAAVEAARRCSLSRVLYGMGIEGIGLANARELCRHFGEDISRLRAASIEELTAASGIGEVLAENLRRFFSDPKRTEELLGVLAELRLEKELTGEEGAQTLAGKTVAITGTLLHFSSRKELEERIRTAGGKVSGSVSGKTAYLVNNEVASASAKNRKAHELGVPIVTEEEFLRLLEGEE